MVIYFLRHGVYRKSPGVSDAASPLTDEGAALMEREAAAMERLGVHVDRVLTSPLARARQTAGIVCRALGNGGEPFADERLSPGFGPPALRSILHDYPEADSLLLVGHEPDFSATIGACTGGLRVVCGKGTLARVDIDKLVSLAGALTWLLPAEVLAP